MDTERRVDVGTLLSSIAEQLEQNQGNLNEVDSVQGAGTHGDRISSAFRTAAQAARQSRTDDAGEQLAMAAQAMRQNGQGRAVGYYADGLEEASGQFSGQSGISLSSLGPFLQSFLGGVQRNNPAKPGQGTMLDALGPAVGALMNQRGGGDPRRSALEALAESVTGARGTAGSRGRVDPGAASATGVIGGIVSALLPGILGAVMGRMTGGGSQQQQPQMPQRGIDPGGSSGGLGGLIGQVMGGGSSNRDQGYDQPDGGGGMLHGLGDILGKLGGSQQPQQPAGRDQKDSGGGWWPF